MSENVPSDETFSSTAWDNCAECGRPLDGSSRFWCRAHYVEVGPFKLKITEETIAKMTPPPGGFSGWIARWQDPDNTVEVDR